MHRSRVSTFLIDVRRDEAERAAGFWAKALGVKTSTPPGEPQFTTLEDAVPGYVTAIQAIDAEPRYHLDIETDDVDAEVARLLDLGAVEVSSWEGCRTLRAPGGHLFCVIPVHSDPEYFAERATGWES
jgi:glyoxalase superfamily protein